MKLNELSPPKGARRSPRRVGRGVGSGHGKTAGRGTKGQKSRSGGNIRPGFEGGQMPLQRRLPKRGFTNIFKKRYAVVNIRDLARFEEGTVVDRGVLRAAGLVGRQPDGVKLLGNGAIDYPLFIKVNRCSTSARNKIEAAGGRVEIV
ncbi:MAG: 50S ribosomal protein L15 [Deltaproteobacteria bacterium]|nr:50S ribosomal protein L15 [Deltaproteobacteria bacterium]MCD6138475.1 50S ribosomal protein L15 [Deltaproteobacteria bacterium]OQX60472.1 MAG: 50S ribosomal protein L15 [Desulfococcus sp. 4484_241]RLB96702.1 MAG: 50S ribosomal protein L15 [Deltaproteobacteria bacterium]RLC12861.1 MAG: 50S ribosomal protein L15 [Deltaproteobacteria bacterium]